MTLLEFFSPLSLPMPSSPPFHYPGLACDSLPGPWPQLGVIAIINQLRYEASQAQTACKTVKTLPQTLT